MKKALAIISIILISLNAPVSTYAGPGPRNGVETPSKEIDENSQKMLARLHEIQQMDLSALSREEKKALRKEVKSIRKEMKANNNGIYLSFGAIIIILLLLILIFK